MRALNMEHLMEWLRFSPPSAAEPACGAATAKMPEHVLPALDLSQLPSGRYAVPDGDTRLKVEVQNVDNGKWRGWVFVKDAAEYGTGQRYGAQRPGKTYDGKVATELQLILRDPKAASLAYGKLMRRCGVCGRVLEDAESVARGIGPICAVKKGWL